MTQDEIRAIALEVADKIPMEAAYGWDEDDIGLFSTLFLAAITEKAEPVGEVDSFGRVILKYSPMHGTKLFTNPAIEPALSAARSLTDELMDCVDRLGSEYDTVDPRVWEHILVYAKPVGAAPLPPCILCANGNDLPEGEYCRGCGRSNESNLKRAVRLARGSSEPPTMKVGFAAPLPDEVLVQRKVTEEAKCVPQTNGSGYTVGVGVELG